MLHHISCVLLALVIVATVGCAAQSHRVGQNTMVDFGIVRDARDVTLDSNVPAGAVVGGTLGLMSGRSSGNQARNAILGAGAGAAIAGVSQGDRRGMSYTVDMLNGATTTIVTDQREIHTGDCVAIERVRSTANIRRVTPSYCDRTNAQAVTSIEDHVQHEATECEAAKQQLVDADSKEATELAARKIELLCNA